MTKTASMKTVESEVKKKIKNLFLKISKKIKKVKATNLHCRISTTLQNENETEPLNKNHDEKEHMDLIDSPR